MSISTFIQNIKDNKNVSSNLTQVIESGAANKWVCVVSILVDDTVNLKVKEKVVKDLCFSFCEGLQQALLTYLDAMPLEILMKLKVILSNIKHETLFRVACQRLSPDLSIKYKDFLVDMITAQVECCDAAKRFLLDFGAKALLSDRSQCSALEQDPETMKLVLDKLGQIGVMEAKNILVNVLQVPNSSMFHESAIEGLARIAVQCPEAANMIGRLAMNKNHNEAFRCCIIKQFERLDNTMEGASGVRDFLFAILAQDTNHVVVKKAAEALDAQMLNLTEGEMTTLVEKLKALVHDNNVMYRRLSALYVLQSHIQHADAINTVKKHLYDNNASDELRAGIVNNYFEQMMYSFESEAIQNIVAGIDKNTIAEGSKLKAAIQLFKQGY